MELLEEIAVDIQTLYKNNPTMQKSLIELNPDTIRTLGAEAQKGIDPEDILEACAGGSDSVEYLRKKAENQLIKRKLYRNLCTAFAIKQKADKKQKAGEIEF